MYVKNQSMSIVLGLSFGIRLGYLNQLSSVGFVFVSPLDRFHVELVPWVLFYLFAD